MKNLFSLFCFLFLALLTACQTDDGTGPAITVEPGTAIVVNDYEGWDEIRTSADGSTFFNKYAADGSTIESTYFVLKADTAAPLIGYARFDENQMPRYIYFDGVSIFVDRYDGSLLDASVVVNDSIVLRADSLQLTFDPTRPDTRSFAQNNWVRNLCDVGNLVCGVLSVGAGGALVLAGVASEGATAGLSTPVSVGTFVAGVTSIVGGLQSIGSALNDLFVTKYSDNEVGVTPKDYAESSGGTFLSEMIGKMADEKHMAKVLPAETCNLLNSKGFSLGTLLASLSFSSIDALWGQTMTEEGALRDLYDNCTVLTSKATRITDHTARLNGYVSGSSAQGYRTRYGFIVRSSDDEAVSVPPIDNGIGESFFVDCTKLKEATLYKYIAYFWDYSNGYLKFGAARTFRTDGVPAVLENVSLDASAMNDDNTYTYRLTADVELKDAEGIEDWGFYYLEGNLHKAYSLKDRGAGRHDYGFTYTASSSSVTLDMGTYVKYSEAPGDTLRYSSTRPYTFRHDNRNGVTIQELTLSAPVYRATTGIFGFDITVANKLPSMDGILSYGYFIARRPYNTDLKFYTYYKTSDDPSARVTKHNSIKVLRSQFDNIDNTNFIATCNKYSVGTYIRLKDSTYLRLEERNLPLVYDTKPGIRYVRAAITGITSEPFDENSDRYTTSIDFTVETRGAFWIDTDQTTWNTWSPSGTWRWENLGTTSQPLPIFTEDRLDTLQTSLHYYNYSELDVYHYFTLQLVDGSTVSSDNSLHFTGSTLLDRVDISSTTFDSYYTDTRSLPSGGVTRSSVLRGTPLPATTAGPPRPSSAGGQPDK